LHGDARISHHGLSGRRPLPVVLHGQVRSDEVTARRQGVEERRDDLCRLVGIGEQVQDPDEQQADRLAEVQQFADRRRGQDRIGVANVGLDVGGAALRGGGEQGARVDQDERVVVNVDDPGRGLDRLRDLMDVVRRRQARADVEELPQAGVAGQEPDCAAEEGAILARGDARVGRLEQHLCGRLPVGGEIALAADEIVIDPSGMRPARIDLRG
jgi:hypothetical protein